MSIRLSQEQLKEISSKYPNMTVLEFINKVKHQLTK